VSRDRFERYRRRESSVEEALIEMYLAGVSVRRVEDITEALWGTRVSPSTVSDLNKKIYGTIETWRNRPIEGEHPYVYLDGIVPQRRPPHGRSLFTRIYPQGPEVVCRAADAHHAFMRDPPFQL
jgi:transposase-like protein